MEGDVTVREVATREYVGVSEADPVAGAVEVLLEEGVLGAVVLRGSEPVGMLTADDALSVLVDGADPAATTVGEVMSGAVPAVDADASVAEAAGAMADAGVRSLLVEDGSDLVGVVSERDVVRAAASLADLAGVGPPREPEPTAAAAVDAEGTEYSTQSVCESCGSLTPDLRNFNGQLICGDCREV